jgi:hypothetical protein
MPGWLCLFAAAVQRKVDMLSGSGPKVLVEHPSSDWSDRAAAGAPVRPRAQDVMEPPLIVVMPRWTCLSVKRRDGDTAAVGGLLRDFSYSRHRE